MSKVLERREFTDGQGRRVYVEVGLVSSGTGMIQNKPAGTGNKTGPPIEETPLLMPSTVLDILPEDGDDYSNGGSNLTSNGEEIPLVMPTLNYGSDGNPAKKKTKTAKAKPPETGAISEEPLVAPTMNYKRK